MRKHRLRHPATALLLRRAWTIECRCDLLHHGIVEAHRNRHALGLEDIKRRHATSQAKIGTAVMADAGAGVGSKLNIFLCKPDAMAKRQRWPQKSKAMQVL